MLSSAPVLPYIAPQMNGTTNVSIVIGKICESMTHRKFSMLCCRIDVQTIITKKIQAYECRSVQSAHCVIMRVVWMYNLKRRGFFFEIYNIHTYGITLLIWWDVVLTDIFVVCPNVYECRILNMCACIVRIRFIYFRVARVNAPNSGIWLCGRMCALVI